MPTAPNDWHAKRFQDAKWWRREAERWERLADAASADGDTRHADDAKRCAAGCRQNARLEEIDEEFQEDAEGK